MNRIIAAVCLVAVFVMGCESGQTSAISGGTSSGEAITVPGPEGKLYSTVSAREGLEYVKKICEQGISPASLGFYQPGDAPEGLGIWHSPDKLISYAEKYAEDCTMIFGTLDSLATARSLAAQTLSADQLLVLDRSPDPNSTEIYVQISMPR